MNLNNLHKLDQAIEKRSQYLKEGDKNNSQAVVVGGDARNISFMNDISFFSAGTSGFGFDFK